MDQNKRNLFFCQVLQLLAFVVSLIVGLFSVFIGIVTFATVHKGFGLLAVIGGLILLPIIKNALRTELKLGIRDLYLNLGGTLLIIFGLVSSIEEKMNQQSKELENIADSSRLVSTPTKPKSVGQSTFHKIIYEKNKDKTHLKAMNS